MFYHSLKAEDHLSRVYLFHNHQIVSRTREVLVFIDMHSQNKWTGLELRPELSAFRLEFSFTETFPPQSPAVLDTLR